MWEIKGKDNQTKATVYALEYNGEWMGESYVTVTIESPTPIDFEIDDYLMYRDERFEINYDPGKIKSAPRYEKGDAFKYENIKFNSLADELTRCDFLDVVLGDNQLHFTGLPKFSFYGGVRDLANRMQANLNRAYPNQWTVVVSPEYSDTKELNVSVDTQKVWDALSILVNDFETYFTIKGRTITIGAAGVPAGHLFKYGKGNGLYEIEQNAEADQAIVTRLRAYGSTRNLPHRYYNSLTGADGQKLIPDNMAVQNLMLPSFPYTTQDPYIDSANKAALGIREGTIFFDGSQEGLEEIYPSIEGMTAEDLHKAGVPCNSTGALDEIVRVEQITDNGVGEADGNETKPADGKNTFKVVLKDLGFDIWEHRIAGTTPVLSFKTGMLGGRDFEIVDCKKIESGGKVTGYELELNRVYDDGIQLWFPYKDYNAKGIEQNPNNPDKFVILHIEMPEVYIKAAAQRLKEAATEWLSKNDYSRSIYAPKIDEIFMSRQHDLAMASGGKIKSLHDTLKEGMLLLFEDEDLNIDASIFIDRLTIKEEGAVPTYEVVLKEEKTVGRLDKMQNQIDSLAAGKGQSGTGGYTSAQIRSMIDAYGSTRFLSKLKDDRATGRIASDMGFEIGNYLAGVSGGIFGIDKETGDSFAEVFRLFVRGKAYFETLTTIESATLAGKQYITPGGAIKCSKVEEIKNDAGEVTSYRCYFLSEQDGEKTETKIVVGDQAISEMFNAKTGSDNKMSNHRYWRLVTAVSNDAYTDDSGNHHGYIDLSATDCESGSDIPQAGDVIAHLGNRTDKTRQAAMIFSTVDTDAPSIKLLTEINSYTLVNKDIISQGYDSVKGHAFFKCYGDTYIGSRSGKTYIKFDEDDEEVDIKAKLSVLSTIDGKTLNDYFTGLIPELSQEDIEGFVNNIVGPQLEGIQDQIDGVIETWFYNGVPTLNNYPASEWNTNDLKIQHLGDLYYDNDTGTAYRFSQNAQGDYYWNTITDDAITKALAAAKAAQDTANNKRRIFTQQPAPPYDKGDLWVNATYGTQYNNDILRCITPKTAGSSFAIADWTLASKYTDDTALNNFIAGYQDTIKDIETQIDGKAETWYQPTDPSTAWKTANEKALHKGDLWYCTADIAGTDFKKGTTWYWTGTAWEKQDIPQSVFDTIDGKAEIFVSKPTSGYKENDLWFLEADYKLSGVDYKSGTLVVAKNDMGTTWSANDWVKKDRYTDDTLAQSAIDRIAGYEYLKNALLPENPTQIIGGLIMSTLISLGYTDASNIRHTLAGINGSWVDTLGGRTIGSWWGGPMVDLFDENDVRKNLAAGSYATSLIHMDGTGYFVDGLFRIKKTGLEIGDTANGYGISMGMDGRLIMGNGISINIGGSAQGLAASIESVTTLANKLSNLFTPYLGNTPKTWAEVSIPGTHFDSVRVNVGLWTDEFLSCLGKSDMGGAGGGGGGLVEGIYRWADLGGTFSDADNDTFNAYTLNRIYSELTAADSAISARLADYYTKSEADGRYALGSSLANYVTLNTEQTIKARKNFSKDILFINTAPASANQGRALGIGWYTTSDTTKADTALGIGSMTQTDADGNISSRHLYLGWGTSPWVGANCLAVGKDIFRYKGYDILHAYNYAAMLDGRYVKKSGADTMTGPLTIQSGTDSKLIFNNTDGETNWNLISFRDKGVEYGKLGTQGGTNITWNGNLIFHGGNYASYLDARYLLKSAYTAADVLAKIKTVDGTGSGLDADLLDGYHAESFVDRKTISGSSSKSISELIQENYSSLADSKAHSVKIERGSHAMAFGWFLNNTALKPYGGWFVANYGTPQWVGVNNGVWVDETFAFLSSNVASADKLSDATAYTAWGQTFFQNGKPKSVSGNMTGVGTITASGEIKSTAPSGFRIAYAKYGLILRNDGVNSYFLLTDSGDANGNFNSLRPFLINNSTGRVSMNNGMSTSTATISGLLAAHGGVQIGATADYGWYLNSSRLVAGNGTARGVNVGSLLVSNAWADAAKVPANGIYVKGPVRIGEVTISYDAETDMLKFDKGIYSMGDVSALGVNSDIGGGGGGMSYDRLDAWADYSADKAGYVLSALLGNDLYQNKLGKTEAQSLYQPIGNYLTAHQALDYLNVKDVRGAERLPGYFADRRMSLWFNNTGTPADGYWWAGFQVKGWDNTYGSWQLCASSHNTATRNKNLYFRVGKDDAWEAWRTILDTSNFNSLIGSALTAYVKKAGDIMTGALTVPTLNIVGSAASSAYITSDSATNAFVNVGGKSLMVWDSATTAARPSNSLAGQVSLGLAANRWLNVYANTINVSSAALVSNLNADLLDGYHETVFVRDRDLGSRGDYQHVVFLLWKDSEIANHHIQGKLFTMGGGSIRYQAAAIDIWFSRWSATGYDWKGRFDTWGLGTMMRLVTCTYNGEKWWAVEHTNTQAINLYFTGTAKNVAWTKVHYYTSNTSTVVNSEIYSSREAVDVGTYTVNGIKNALVSDTVANASALGGISASEYLTKSNYAATLDGRYVNKAGDTVTGPLTIQSGTDSKLIFNNTDGEKYTCISFRESGTEYAAITASKVEVFVSSLPFVAKYFRADTETLCPKLNADLLDGVHLSGLFRKDSINGDADDLTVSGVYMTYAGISNTPNDTNGNQLLHFNWDANAANQLYLRYNSDRVYARRKIGGVWQAWKTFAFLDDNVASATRLATTASFTAWGQIFFANGVPKSIEGNLNGVGDIGARGGAYGNFQITRGLATGEAMRIEPLDANGSWLKNCITMDTDGNLKIGSTGRATHKLHVNGYVRANGLTLDGSHLLEWDAANEAWKFNGNLYATGSLSALGVKELSATEASVDSLKAKSILFNNSSNAFVRYIPNILWIGNMSGMIMFGDNQQSGSQIIMTNTLAFGGQKTSSGSSYYIDPSGDATLKSLNVRTGITAASVAIKTSVFTVEGTEIYVTFGETKYKLVKTAVS